MVFALPALGTLDLTFAADFALQIFRRTGLVLNLRTECNNRPFEFLQKTRFVSGESVLQFVMYVPKRAKARHGFPPPLRRPARLHEQTSCSFFNSSDCSLCHSIGLWPVRSTGIVVDPQITHGSIEFLGAVGVDTLWFRLRSKKSLKSQDYLVCTFLRRWISLNPVRKTILDDQNHFVSLAPGFLLIEDRVVGCHLVCKFRGLRKVAR